jgi:AraC family transcriptional regulator
MVENSRQKYLYETYKARINRVIDYIEINVDSEFSLATLADIAGFSPFHFHRIFTAMVGETLSAFISRVRIEKAAARLINNPRKSITDVAFEYGFSSSSVFARAFKDTFKMSASHWRSGGYNHYSKMSKINDKDNQANHKIRQEFHVYPDYTTGNKQIWRVEMKSKNVSTNIEIKEVPEIHVAYIRHIGPYKGDQELFGRIFNKLCTWAGPRGLLNFPQTKFLTIYYDDPEITEKSRLRTDVCITVPADAKVDGEIGKATIPAGSYAIAHFEIKPDQFQDAWDTLCGGWLPESGYQPADGPCYELYLNDPKQHPEGKFIVDICLPVKPM